MILDIKTEEWYVPKWNNNRELEKKEQISVLIQPPSGISSGKAAVGALPYQEDPEAMNTAFDFVSYCTKVKNLKLRDESGKIKNGTPIDIATVPGLWDLFFEIRQYYKDNYYIDKKK